MPDILDNFRRELPLCDTEVKVEWMGYAMQAQGTYTPEVQHMLAVRLAEIQKGKRK